MPAVKLYRYFQKHRPLLFILVLATVAGLVYFSSRLKVEEDITKFIPKDKKTDEVNATLRDLKITDKIILNLFHKDSTSEDPSDLMACADILADSLNRAQKNYIQELNYKVSDDLMFGVYGTFYAHLPIFLEEPDYARISNLISDDSIRNTLRNNYATLLSPSGVVLGRYLQQDPLNLTPLALKKTQNLQVDANFEINEGYIQTSDKKNLLLIISPNAKPAEYARNKQFITSLEQIIASCEKQFENVDVQYYGAAPVSVGNSDQIRKDTVFTSIIALFVICLLLYFYFRRLLIIFFILLPVIFGALFSLTVLYFLKGEISVIAIGAGSIVLGIAINYSLHFFTHFKHEPSPENVIKDLTLPMLIGGATTIAAFLSLQFTKSATLHDFGLFAGFSLIGAIVFSIIVLPHLLRRGRNSPSVTNHDSSSGFEKLFSYRLDKNKPVTIIAFVLTVVFAFCARNVTFETDMMKMNFQNKEMISAQQNLERINKFSLTSVYLVSKGNDLENALRKNEKVTVRLQDLQNKGLIKRFSSPGTVLISDSLQKVRIARWNTFWTKEKKDSVSARLVRNGKLYKFREDAFAPFMSQLTQNFEPISLNDLDTLKKTLVNDWVNENKGSVSLVNVIKVDPAAKETVFASFENTPGVVIFDKQFITSRFIEAISSDFSLILMITGCLVFGFMLLSHGRIELAIINFLPMFISWLWILGIMALLGLKFNIINIIISTFIFGLGDDYSIFIMDGLAHEYKFGRKNLASYKTSIVLSALTNIVGIGVLIFAEHPALRSIAAITIVGMCAVLFISFIVQPLLYDFLILKRKRRKLLPYTAFNLFVTGIGFIIFIIGSLFLTLFGFLFFAIIPAPTRKKKLIFHYLLMYICRFMIYLFFHVKKEIINPQKEKFSKPSIIIANHQSHIDLAMMLMLHPKIIVFTNDWVWNSPFYGFIVKMADFYPASQGYENALGKIEKLTGLGYSVLIFPEGTRSTTGEILRFHKGAFYLAERLQLDIQPMLMHGTGDLVTKNDFHFKEGSLTLKYLERITPSDKRFGETYKERAKEIRLLLRREYDKLRAQKETVAYYRPKLIKNYIYKGPILEWYCRIKVKMEGNYEIFEKHLPKKGEITDVGCGYGFLSLMLSFMSPERRITGVDYDDEKIMIAANCVSKTENVNFIYADVTKHEFNTSDAFIINDVLHYLEPDQQVTLIEHCAEKLNAGGVMIIRDADADKKKRHLGTRYTEFFSTNSGFNKTAGSGLHFTSADLIRNTLDKFDFLSYKVIDDTKLTSNITFLITNTKAISI